MEWIEKGKNGKKILDKFSPNKLSNSHQITGMNVCFIVNDRRASNIDNALVHTFTRKW